MRYATIPTQDAVESGEATEAGMWLRVLALADQRERAEVYAERHAKAGQYGAMEREIRRYERTDREIREIQQRLDAEARAEAVA